MDIAIAGGGLSGPLAAVFLARRGHSVTIYERRADPRAAGVSEGRSINLALSARGIDALRRVQLDEAVMAHAIPMRGRMLHDRDGSLSFQSYSADGSKAINSVSRGALNNVLLSAAEASPGVTVKFQHRVITATEDGAVELAAPHGDLGARHDLVIGMDGAFSAVRDRIVHAPRTEYHQQTLPWGYKELTIPAGTDGGFVMDQHSLHIWPRQHSMMIALPNPDGSFTATLFWPYDGPHGFADLHTAEDVLERFRSDYPDAVALMPHLTTEFAEHPVGSLTTVRVWPWTAGRLALLGDAAHAIVPFYGQGMNCAFEDVVELDRCLDDHDEDVLVAVATCAQRRKPNADAIAEMALDNFVEMRDKVGSPWFRTAKRVEQGLERLAPEAFTSLYELVSFTTVPYAEAQRRGRRQRAVLGGMADGMDSLTRGLASALRRAR
jgi:kynurenine 3-monooxygenase